MRNFQNLRYVSLQTRNKKSLTGEKFRCFWVTVERRMNKRDINVKEEKAGILIMSRVNTYMMLQTEKCAARKEGTLHV